MSTTKIKLNKNWKFHLGNIEEAWYKGFDDTDWEDVIIPHDWSVTLPFSKENSSGTAYLSGGTGWYRSHFSSADIPTGKRVKLVFDGVYKNAGVWINSYYLGPHAYGYTPFEFDITDFLSPDGDNEISVSVSHEDISDSRWYPGTGITRDVFLYITDPVHVVSGGISFVTKSVTDKGAMVKCTLELINESDSPVKADISAYLDGFKVKEHLSLTECTLAPMKVKKITLEGIIPDPKLWDVDAPNLYTLHPVITLEDEKYTDLPVKVGIRTFSFDTKEGFILNGKKTILKGVCVHHDGGCLGAAMAREIWERRLKTLRECGCNAIRCSHNPHMNALYDLCDEMGFVVMDEAFDEWENAKNKWWNGHNVYPPRHQGYYDSFHEWHERDLRAMVRRDRVHPSVVLYSIGNEIDYPNDPYCHPSFEEMTGNNDKNKPSRERQYDPCKPNMERLSVIAKELVAIVKDEEPTALVTMALAFPELSLKLGIGDSLDVLGFNYKEHLYKDTHKSMPKKPLVGSENGHSYRAFRAVTDNDYVAGQFLWTGIDYLGEALGWPVHGSFAGLLTTAGFKKAEFYQTKSYWTDSKDCFLATAKKPDREAWVRFLPVWKYREGDVILLKCFAGNAPDAHVAFYLNDKLIADSFFDEESGAFLAEAPFTKGTVSAHYMVGDKELSTSSVYSDGNLKDVSCSLFADSKDPDYIYQIEVGLMDSQNRIIRTNDRDVTVTVEGPGMFLGIENGNLADLTEMQSSVKSTYLGQAIVYVRRTAPGDIKVTIKVSAIKKEFILR